jgi:hypothetical protein
MPFDHLDDLKFIDERTALTAALASKPLSDGDREAVRLRPRPWSAPPAPVRANRAWSRASCRSSACRPAKAWR